MGKLEGKVAIVTGSSKGIGKAIAFTLAAEGAKVLVDYFHDREAAEAVVKTIKENGGKAMAFYADVSKYEDAKGLAETARLEFGGIDILVNNSGITRDKSFKNMSQEQWREVMATDLDSVYNCTHNVLPTMLAQKSGSIINISSAIGQMGAFGQSNYAAAKAGMIGFTKSLALETAKQGITVNAVCPGYIATEMVSAMPEEVLNTVRAKIPMNRLGTVEEVAKVVLFLVTDGTYITGQQLNINGGLYM